MENKNISKIWINGIYVENFKSLYGKNNLELKPITILAGPNSSGKSSIVKPLLLLKQTLESSYDPGPLLLDGSNVKITSLEQILSKCNKVENKKFLLGLSTSSKELVKIQYTKSKKSIKIQKLIVRGNSGRPKAFSEDMKFEEKYKKLPKDLKEFINYSKDKSKDARENKDNKDNKNNIEINIFRNRCFLECSVLLGEKRLPSINLPLVSQSLKDLIRNIIHLTGFRGNPERLYPVTSISDSYPGNFETYVASIIYKWYINKSESIDKLNNYLSKLGLTNIIVPEFVSDTQVEIKVGRISRNKTSSNLVNIADVGFGVSQSLPILVALIAAKENQTVYIEEPEIHLHPKAQFYLAEILVDAAKRGVKLIIETHSTILLLGLQTLVAEDIIPSDDVILHWFHRNAKGITEIETANLDEKGTYGKWPEDFADTFLNAEDRYLRAVEHKLQKDNVKK